MQTHSDNSTIFTSLFIILGIIGIAIFFRMDTDHVYIAYYQYYTNDIETFCENGIASYDIEAKCLDDFNKEHTNYSGIIRTEIYGMYLEDRFNVSNNHYNRIPSCRLTCYIIKGDSNE
jgi:hypothetical protein